jgi:MFS transporter, SHS family, sialic acid transporter
MALIAAFLGWMFDGLEMGVFPLVARPALQDLLGATSDQLVGLWMGRITALFLLGAASGGLVFGWLGDRIGRVRAMILSVLAYSLLTGLCYFATAPWQLGALRFMAALGMGGEWSLGVALVMECWHEKHRPMLAGFIGIASNVGFGLIALVGLKYHVTRDSWRWIMLAGTVPALLALFIARFVPESKRWTESAKKGGVAFPIREVFSRELWKTTVLSITFASIALIGTWASVQWLPTWADQLTGGKDPTAKALTQILSAGGAIVGSFLAPLVGHRIGRRPVYFLLCLGSLVTCGYLFRCVNEFNGFFLMMVGLVGSVTAAFYGWLPLYLPELFPTRVRATGQGLSYNFGRVFAAIGTLCMGQMIHFYGDSYARAGATITLVYLLGIVLIWLAPETKGKPLPE